MNAEVRRRIEMGTRALEFSRAHPDTEPGTQAAVSKLEQQVARAKDVATAQRDGIIHVHAAAQRKQELRRAMLSVPIAHLAKVGAAAAREEHELAQTFRFKPSASTFLAFRTAALGMESAALTHKELLAKYGLSASVLEEFSRTLEQFEAALALGNEGRTAHVGATKELNVVAQEIVRTVQVMDGRNRQRFADDAQLLGSWSSASRVLGQRRAVSDTPASPADGVTPPAGGAAPAGGEVRPAA